MPAEHPEIDTFVERFESLPREDRMRLLAMLGHQLTNVVSDYQAPRFQIGVIGGDTEIMGVNEALGRVTNEILTMSKSTDDSKRPLSSEMLKDILAYGCSKELKKACQSALESFDQAKT